MTRDQVGPETLQHQGTDVHESTPLERVLGLRENYLKTVDLMSLVPEFSARRWDSTDPKFRIDTQSVESAQVRPEEKFLNNCICIVQILGGSSKFRSSEGVAFSTGDAGSILEYLISNWKEAQQDTYHHSWCLRAAAAALKAEALQLQDSHAAHSIRKLEENLEKLFENIKATIKIIESFLDETVRNSGGAERFYSHPYFLYSVDHSLLLAKSAITELSQALTNGQNDVKKHVLDGVKSVKSKIDRVCQDYEQDILKWVSIWFYRSLAAAQASAQASGGSDLDEVALISSLLVLCVERDSRAFFPDDQMLSMSMDLLFNPYRPFGYWKSSSYTGSRMSTQFGSTTAELGIGLLQQSSIRHYIAGNIQYISRLMSFFVGQYDVSDPATGWSSELQRGTGTRETWYGFLVFRFIELASDEVRRHAAKGLLAPFQRGETGGAISFDKLHDGMPHQYKSTIKKHLLHNHRLLAGAKSDSEYKEVRKTAKYSAILFGPPGTGKTTIARSIARELNYDHVEIGPGDFLRNGVDGIFSQGDEIFKRLMLADRSVVLFDELDEWVLERGRQTDKMSRFLTTYMLPWLQRLRDRSELIFLFATNRIEVFDSAIKRHGRFDLVIPIGPPDEASKAQIVNEQLGKFKAPDVSKELVAEIVGRIEVRATLGDIKRGFDLFSAADGFVASFAKNSRLPQVINHDLTIDPETWRQFEVDCRKYAPNFESLETIGAVLSGDP